MGVGGENRMLHSGCLLLLFLLPLVSPGAVPLCKTIDDCATCADSHVHVFGFKENCRWCIETDSCGGPFSCPLGKAVVQRDPFKCPQQRADGKGRAYTDRLGRSVYSVALAARDSNVTECLHNSRPDIGYAKPFSVECDKAGNTCAGLIAVSEEAKAIYIAYKGSTFDKQLFAEFVHGLAAQLGAWEKFIDDAGVITYFHSAFTKLFLEGGMKKEFEAQRKKYPSYRVWITGHSLGGSLASMTALYLTHHKLVDPKKVRLITFGEPRTGNVAFAKAVEKNVEFRYRVVKKNDFVTNIPNSVDPNAVLLTSAMYDRQPLFYRYLIHYDNAMKRDDKFKECDLSDDHGCRNLAGAIDINDHSSYFGITPEEYSLARCKRNLLQ